MSRGIDNDERSNVDRRGPGEQGTPFWWDNVDERARFERWIPDHPDYLPETPRPAAYERFVDAGLDGLPNNPGFFEWWKDEMLPGGFIAKSYSDMVSPREHFMEWRDIMKESHRGLEERLRESLISNRRSQALSNLKDAQWRLENPDLWLEVSDAEGRARDEAIREQDAWEAACEEERRREEEERDEAESQRPKPRDRTGGPCEIGDPRDDEPGCCGH